MVSVRARAARIDRSCAARTGAGKNEAWTCPRARRTRAFRGPSPRTLSRALDGHVVFLATTCRFLSINANLLSPAFANSFLRLGRPKRAPASSVIIRRGVGARTLSMYRGGLASGNYTVRTARGSAHQFCSFFSIWMMTQSRIPGGRGGEAA
jgi:hypothetical protein